MNALVDVGSPRQEALEVVIAELERSLVIMEANYQKAVSNLSTLRRCVDTDDLTRLLRRGAFMRKLQNLLTDSKAEGREVILMMIDVDHFKRVNDGHGHQAGDAVLERVSELVRSYMRPTDLAGRYGGEEIIVAMQATSSEAMAIAEGIRKAVERERVLSPSRVELSVTLSAGVASTRNFEFEAGVLIERADSALYRAKETGRNRVVMAEGPRREVELHCEAA
jgi:diguanylate cyclase (GGDEF)-like protein